MIEVVNLTKHYGHIKALEDVTFMVRPQEVVGFLGPNGAGKTTTMQIITGYLNPTSGTVLVDELDVRKDPWKVKKRLGYLPENAPLYDDLTVYDFLCFVADVRGVTEKTKALRQTVELCGIGDVLTQSIGTLSKGYRQRVAIAQAVLHNPPILILDEPTTGLDPLQIDEIRQLIRQLGSEKTVLLSTHILPEVEQTCSRVVVINRGRIVADSPIETLKTELSGGTVVVQYRGDLEPDQLNRFGRVEVLSREDGTISVRITPEKGNDIREDIYRFIKSQDVILLEMYSEKRTLEEIFRELTVREDEVQGTA